MLSRIAFVLLVFLVLPAPAHAQREGCWPNGAGGFQCSSNCRVTACNDYYDRYGQIRKKCRFQCARQQPQAFAPQHSNQRVAPRADPPRPRLSRREHAPVLAD